MANTDFKPKSAWIWEAGKEHCSIPSPLQSLSFSSIKNGNTLNGLWESSHYWKSCWFMNWWIQGQHFKLQPCPSHLRPWMNIFGAEKLIHSWWRESLYMILGWLAMGTHLCDLSAWSFWFSLSSSEKQRCWCPSPGVVIKIKLTN